MSKYLKLFNQDAEYQQFKESEEYILPNVSFVVESNSIAYKPYTEVKSSVIMARYNATEENKLAIADTSNVKSLKVNGTEVEFADTYYFSEVGEYDVEIELIDKTLINGANMNSDMPPKSMFWGILENGPKGACLTSIILPEGIITIGLHAFCECLSLTSVVIPDSVTYIGDNAFNSCSNLNDIHIGSGVTTIGYYAFDRCTSLPLIDNIRYADEYLVEATDKTLTTYNIKEGTKFIGDGAFRGCSGLTSINIPDSVTSIGGSAFSSCSGLTSIVIPDSVTEIGWNAFTYCSGLTSVHIGSGVTYIGDGAFGSCSGLTSIVVSEGNTVYDSRENCNCIIETATNTLIKGCQNSFIPDSVTSIGTEAFASCSGLTGELIIPDSVTSIGGSTFYGCSGLTSVHIGLGVTSIGGNAFASCSGLTSIICNAITAPTIKSSTFRNVKSGGVLKVPVGSNYSSWMSTSDDYLGYYNWTIEYI